MRLRSLNVDRLPGISERFSLADFADGVNIVVGPNASGKSSIVRALRAVLYAEERPGPSASVAARLTTANGDCDALRLGTQLTWQSDGVACDPPALPPHRFLSCFTLSVEDLLAAEAATDTVIAERLGRELAGGYDINSIRRAWPFRLKTTHAKPAGQALDEARRARRQREAEREALRRDEACLADLEQRQAEADEARSEATRAAAAAALLTVRRERLNLEAQLGRYPDGMDRLRGDEWERLTDNRRRADELAEERERAREAGDEAEARAAATGLADSDLDDAAINEHRRLIQRLLTRESELDAKGAERERAQARWRDAVAALGGEPSTPLHLEPAALARVQDALAEKRDRDATIAQLDKELARNPAAEDALADPETLAVARSELMDWLAAPDEQGWSLQRWALVVAGLAAGAGGIVAGAVWGPWPVALLGLLWLAGPLGLLQARAKTTERDGCVARFRRSGLAEPAGWSRDAAQQRLRAIDQQLLEAREASAREQRRREIEQALAAYREDQQAVQDRLGALGREYGFDSTLAELPLARWLALASEYDEARRALAQADADLERLTTAVKDLRDRLVAFLTAYDQAPTASMPGADELASQLDALGERLEQYRKACRERDQAAQELARLDNERAAAQRAASSVYEAAGVSDGDDTTLRQRLDALDDWRGTVQRLNDARSREAERDRDLGPAPDWRAWVDGDDLERIQARQRQLEEQAAQRDAIRDEIQKIRHEIENAGNERRLEQARSAEQEAEEGLAERLDDALFADAGDYLLEQVANEHRRSSRPRALARAQDWFAAFTHHAFSLDLGEQDDTAFVARENSSGEWRRLAELSSGTRMQLLLAARMGFALEVEQGGESLPLVLDEALTTADPERFRAAVTSLYQLAAQGRQIVYLTAQPSDLGYFQEAEPDVRRFDLGELRQAGAALPSPEAVALPATEPIPVPGDEAAEAYAVRLGVPTLDPWADAGMMHCFYLTRDDLPLLHRLVQLQLERLGPLSSFLAAPTAATALADGERQRLDWRIAGARAWVAAWRIGRGYPVDREALAASDTLSDTFFDRVAAINDELGGDAEQLVDALSDGAVKGLYKSYRQALAEWLLDNGYRDERQRLDDQQILQQVLEAVLPRAPDRDTAIQEARYLRDSLSAAVPR